MISMNKITRVTHMPDRTTPENPPASHEDNDACLEQQMADLGLSSDTRRFLRDLHAAEKQLNDAFSEARQGGDLEQRVSQVYRKMYGAG
jgi:hypothetical protein